MATTKNNSNGNGFTAHFKVEKETKGAVRYMQVTKDGKDYPQAAGAELGSVYIRKTAFKGETPERITMVVTRDK
jgi:hypothetical protein